MTNLQYPLLGVVIGLIIYYTLIKKDVVVIRTKNNIA